MPRYLITRELPGAGTLSTDDLAKISAKSNAVLAEMGPDVQWDHSYVTGDHINCVYVAADEELIREHARRGGFPCTEIREVAGVIDPVTGGA